MRKFGGRIIAVVSNREEMKPTRDEVETGLQLSGRKMLLKASFSAQGI